MFLCLKSLGLGPDPDWIRIQQQPGSGSGFCKISESGFSKSRPDTKHCSGVKALRGTAN